MKYAASTPKPARANGSSPATPHPPTTTAASFLERKHLCLAGAPDTWESFQGNKGGILMVVSKTDGKVVFKQELPSAPVYDGMSAANGSLFISCKDGSILCFGNSK